MPSCVFRRCTNYDAKVNKTQGISYHMFPTNPLALQEWIKAVREQRREYDWKPSKSSRVCSDHFISEHKYISSQGRMLLRKNAIPVVEKYEGYNIPVIFPEDQHYTNTSEVEEIIVLPTIELPTLHINKMNRTWEKIQRKKRTRVQKKKRPNKKFASMAVILEILKKRNFISQEQCKELKLKSKVIDLINISHRKKSKKSRRKKVPLFFRKFALTLNFYSLAAYNYVRKSFYTALPPIKLLVKWYQNTSASPGFTKQAFDLLKKKSRLSGSRVLCNLMADEIPIRHETLWTGKKSDGLTDFGIETSTNNEIATHVYIFILVALNENWKIPLGYFFVKSLPAETRAYLISTCISKCVNSGADIIAVTLDGCSSNVAAANILGCNLSTPRNLKSTFKHPDCRKEVAIFFDPCHMIKLVRNTFESKKIILKADNKNISWKLIAALNKLLASQTLNFVNKQSQTYFKFRNELMRIRLSTQLFSKNIGHALQLCDKLIISSRIRDIDSTVEFISIFNDLFDILNSRPCEGLGFKQPISRDNFKNILFFLDKAKQYILSLCIYNIIKRSFRRRTIISLTKKPIVDCKSNTGFLGFLIGIQSLKYLYVSYFIGATPLMPFIATNKLTLGNNEIYFGLTRSTNDSSKNLSSIQFKEVYRKIFNLLQLLPSSMCGNCVSLEHIPILPFLSSGVENINYSSGRRALDKNEMIVDITTHSDKSIVMNVGILIDIMNNEYCVSPAKLVIGYISSWIARKLLRIIKCETCVDALYTDKKMWYHKLISLNSMDGLCFSSQSLWTVCLKCESFIKPYIKVHGIHLSCDRDVKKLKTLILKTFIGLNIFDSLEKHSMQQAPAFNHRLHLILSIIDEFTNIRICLVNKNNSDFKKITETQSRKKLCLF